MGLEKIQSKETTVLGIDASTKSFAYCLIKGEAPVEWGIINYKGKDRFQRALDSANKVDAFVSKFGRIDKVVQEQAVGSVNQQTGLFLAQAYGVTMPSLLRVTNDYSMVGPNEWQAALGVKIMTPTQIKAQWPDHTKSWYSEKTRELKKQRTIDWVKGRWGIELTYDMNDISDAIGICSWAAKLI